jgi:hypothetical protein
LQLADAQQACIAKGVRCRVVEVNGESRPITMDYAAERLNFKIEAGKISSVSKG